MHADVYSLFTFVIRSSLARKSGQACAVIVDTQEISRHSLQTITFIRPLYQAIISDHYYYRKSAEKREIINSKGCPQNIRMPSLLSDSISPTILFLCTPGPVSIAH